MAKVKRLAIILNLAITLSADIAWAEGDMIGERFRTLNAQQICGDAARIEIERVGQRSSYAYDGQYTIRYLIEKNAVYFLGYGTNCVTKVESSSSKRVWVTPQLSFGDFLDRDPFLDESNLASERFIRSCKNWPEKKAKRVLSDSLEPYQASEIMENLGSYCEAIDDAFGGLLVIENGSEVALIRFSGGLVTIWRK